MGHDRSLPKELKAIRKQWGMSVADLSEILDIGERTLAYWESGTIDVSLDQMTRWADALGYDLRLELRKS